MRNRLVTGIDLFCGAGGLTYGLRRAGISIVAGIDSDPACEFPFTWNNGARFIKADVRELTAKYLSELYPPGTTRLLAGCAPCRPFSPFRRGAGAKNSSHDEWGLLGEFGRFV
jgi:DNA (cytosine-5)-methyltransferase 1